MITLFFYIFATILLVSSVLVITVRNTVYAVLFLVLSFFTSAALWMMLEAEFLAIVLVLVYVGAVMVLFLFVVMMLNINITAKREGFTRYLPVGIIVAAIMLFEIISVVGVGNFGLEQIGEPLRHPADYSNIKELGRLLYTVYVYPFEIAGAILLVAIVAAIALAFRRRSGNKAVDPAQQVRVKKEDRLRIVAMKTEKKEQLK